MAKKRSVVRFGVGKPEGPRAHVWLLWTSTKHSDVFITGYGFRHSQKVSLHKSGKWRKAFMESSPFVTLGKDRATDKWERPPEVIPGVTKAFEMIVPSSEATMPKDPEVEPDWQGKVIIWIPTPPKDTVVYFTVVYTALELSSPGRGIAVEVVEGSNTYLARSIADVVLPNGQRIWVLAHTRPITEEQKEQLQLFRRWQAQANGEIGEAEYSALPKPRSYFYGYEEDGTRFFIDVSGVHL